MQKSSFQKTANQFLPNRYTQISESHCGPAVLQMLLANVGIITSQEKITDEAGASQSIETDGTTPLQLAKAAKKIAPGISFWMKDKSNIDDLRILVNEFKFPVAVEWQGVFEDGQEMTPESATDYGHYSIITFIDEKQLIIVDPYKDFASQDRVFSVKEFIPRWWDSNEVEENGKKTLVKDEQLIFIVTPKDTIFPSKLGMQKL